VRLLRRSPRKILKMRAIQPRGVAFFALGVALAACLLNIYLLIEIRRAEHRAESVLARAADLADGGAPIRVPIRIPAGIPIRAEVPLDERVLVRLDTVLPVRTRAVLPLRSPLGNYDIRVPVHADVPIRMNLPVHIRHTVRIDARTHEEIVVPLEFRLQDLPLDSLRRELSRQ
jgi:hypothetical protein